MRNYKYEIENRLRCFKCGSENVTDLYKNTNDSFLKFNRKTEQLESIESENYNIHYDCLICLDCKNWDFPDMDLWEENYLIGGHKCDCGNTDFKITYNDIFSDSFEVKCLKCNKKYILEKEESKEL